VTSGGVNDGVSGVITGNGFTKGGVGSLKISGTNGWLGTTTISGGTLQLGSGNSIPNVSDVSLTSSGSVLDMNGYSETINTLASTFTSSVVGSSGSGNYTLTVGAGASGPGTNSTVYNGILQDNIGSGSGVMNVVYNLYGSNYNATLGGVNTYSGLTTITQGILYITNSSSLGKNNTTSGLGTVVSSNSSLYMQGGIIVGDESLVLNGASNNGSLYNVSGNNVWGGSITLGSASTIWNNSGTLTINPSSGSAIVSTNLGLTISGGGSSTVSGTVSLGTGGLTTNNGVVTLMTDNSYSGATSVANGSVLNVRTNVSLGTSAVTVANGATLQLQGGIVVSNVLTLNGLGVSNVGSLRSISGVNEYAGNITLSGVTPVRVNTDLNSLLISGNIIGGTTPLYFGSSVGSGSVTTTVSGVISGGGGSLTWGTSPTQVALNTSVVKDNNFLTLVLSSTSNSYTGATVLGSMNIPNGGSGAGTLLLGASEVINNGSHIVFNGGSLNTGGNIETVGLMSLLQDGGTLTLGGSVHDLKFSGIGTFDYKTLTISGWQGTAGSSGSAGDIYVGSSLFFTRQQLDQIKFSYNSGTFSSKQLSSGELVPDVSSVTTYANIRITTGATTNGSWSPQTPTSSSTNVNTTYTFTPSGNNVTINVNEIYWAMYNRYSHVTINTTTSPAVGTQSGIIDINAAMTEDLYSYTGYNKTLTMNAAGDINVNQAIIMQSASTTQGNGNTHSITLNSSGGSINVYAAISTQQQSYSGYCGVFGTSGNITLSAPLGNIYASVGGSITASGGLNGCSASYDGYGGAITITGGSVSIGSTITSSSRRGASTSYYGNVSITNTNTSVTGLGGVNDGVSGMITGNGFTKGGVGSLKISGTNGWLGTTTISGGTLQLGSGTNIPDASAVYFTGGNLNDGGFSETMGALFLSNSATITLGNAAHSLTFASAGTFAGTASTTMLSIVGYNGLDATTAVTTNGTITSTSTVFVNYNGKKQSTVIGGMSQNGRILYGMSGATGNPTSIFIKSAMSGTQLGQIQFYNNGSNSYYSTTQKPVAGTNGEIVPNAPK
jgi:autotransporter-associated beta strand protein